MTIVLYIISLFILYLVIQAAVRNAIDQSEVGKIIRSKHGVDNNSKKDKKSFLDDDLDRD